MSCISSIMMELPLRREFALVVAVPKVGELLVFPVLVLSKLLIWGAMCEIGKCRMVRWVVCQGGEGEVARLDAVALSVLSSTPVGAWEKYGRSIYLAVISILTLSKTCIVNMRSECAAAFRSLQVR